jgi:hypothetical protein
MSTWMIPLPELVVVFVIAILIFGPRTIWRIRKPLTPPCPATTIRPQTRKADSLKM